MGTKQTTKPLKSTTKPQVSVNAMMSMKMMMVYAILLISISVQYVEPCPAGTKVSVNAMMSMMMMMVYAILLISISVQYVEPTCPPDRREICGWGGRDCAYI